MIELINVSKYYNNNGVVALGLRNVNLKLSKGEIVAIVGESGSGKSTLLNVICGVDTYEEGEILFKGNETSYFNQDDMDNYRKQNVSFIYQSYNIIDSYTVLENVMLPLLINGLDYKKAKERALELINRVGLSNRIKHRGIKLSGGEKQRCVIARALASDCEILACDEPTGNLDSKTGADIIKLIKEVAKDKLVLIVTHNYEQVSDIVTRTIRVSDGEIVEDSIKEVIDIETNEEIDFSVNKIKRNKLMWISLRNLKNTPKKNVLTLAVFFVLSIIGFFLFLSCLAASEESQYNPYKSYVNTVHNRLIVYDSEHKSLDMDKISSIKGTIYENAFYEDKYISLSIDFEYLFSGSYSTYLPKNINVVAGTSNINDGEAFVVLPISETYYISSLNDLIEENGSVMVSCNSTVELKLCGIAQSKDLTNPLIVTKKDYSKDIFTNFYTTDVTAVKVNGNIIKAYTVMGDANRIYYHGPETEINEIVVTLNDIYDIEIGTYEVFITKDSDIYCNLQLKELIIDDVYEAVVYADNINSAIKTIKEAGYSYYQPAKSGFNKTSFNYILFILYTVLSCLAMLVLTFIAYIILARVYSSKNKDYTILRSLGLVKKQLAKIVDYEVLLSGFAGALLALLGYYTFSIFNYDVKYMMSYNTVWFTILYLVLMLIFSYFISRRFNKRLFKFSISTSIKDEVE